MSLFFFLKMMTRIKSRKKMSRAAQPTAIPIMVFISSLGVESSLRKKKKEKKKRKKVI